MNKKTIAVIGLGYVGLPLALLADKKGHKVIGIIRDQEKADLINEREVPFKDELVERELPNSSIEATIDFSRVTEAEIIIICVPTPVHEDYTPNLQPIISSCTNIAKYLQKGQLVILESTVNPGVSEDIILPLLESGSGLKAGVDFELAHCPERINPGDPKWNVENINRVVGSLTDKGLERAVIFYQSILNAKIKKMGSLKEAEAVKVVENSFRDINIAFVNELAMSFAKLGIDTVNVIEGAATKPFAFMAHYPGSGVGGHCIPVDPYYLIEYAKTKGFDHDFLSLARRINNQMPQFTVDLLVEGLNEKEKSIKGSEVAVLGLSYKANIDDDRESPSYDIIKILKERSANVRVYDPYLIDKSTVDNLDHALSGSDAIIIATSHNEFRNLQPYRLEQNNIQVVIDGRNLLNSDQFKDSEIFYKAVGR